MQRFADDVCLAGNQICNVCLHRVTALPPSPAVAQVVFLTETDGEHAAGYAYYWSGAAWRQI